MHFGVTNYFVIIIQNCEINKSIYYEILIKQILTNFFSKYN